MRLISLNIAQNILNFTRMHYLFFSYISFAISAYSKEYKTPKLAINSNYIPNMTNVSIFRFISLSFCYQCHTEE